MPTVTDGAWQQRIEQPVAPEIDVSGAADVGEDEVQAAVDAEEAKGYVGHSPSETSS